MYWGVLSYKYKYIYFALQKIIKKNKHEINDSRGMLFSLQAGCLFFFLQLKLYTTKARTHTYRRTHMDLQGPALLRSHRSTDCVDSDPGDRDDVELSPGSSHSSAHGCV